MKRVSLASVVTTASNAGCGRSKHGFQGGEHSGCEDRTHVAVLRLLPPIAEVKQRVNNLADNIYSHGCAQDRCQMLKGRVQLA